MILITKELMKNNYREIASLVSKLKANDQSVFPRIYELTYQKLYFLCFSILKNEEDSKDALQETYIKILANISSLQDNTLFIAWANKIAYSVSIRMVTKNGPDPVDDEFLVSFADEDESRQPSASAEKSERARVLSSMIDNLEENLRTTLILKYFDGLKISQIASIMGCPEGTVKSRLNTAKRLLKTSIEKERKGGILLSAFFVYPIHEALAYSSASTAFAPEAAKLALESIVSKSGISCSVAFTPQPAAQPVRQSNAANVVASATTAAAGVAAVAASAYIALSPPVIGSINVGVPASGYVNGDVAVTANVDAPLKTIREVYLISDDGNRIDGSFENKTASFSVDENGTYTIHVVTVNDLTSTADFSVSAIDDSAPTISGFDYTEDYLTIELNDTGSGIDFSSIKGVTENGQAILPVSFDEKNNTVTFAFPKENFKLSVNDLAGNESHHSVKLTQE